MAISTSIAEDVTDYLNLTLGERRAFDGILSYLTFLAFIPFEQCQPLSRGFENIPPRPGIYAIRHRTDGLLYIGKTKSLRDPFQWQA
ncbi:hypothetical protein [Iningainema tapete]|uniref:hypothetical protein n=1 Tax=Iningainema tapete TaxID=2806730 RepID=UPI001EE31F5C|nr:hypothetical protein [Iningainema tapete]